MDIIREPEPFTSLEIMIKPEQKFSTPRYTLYEIIHIQFYDELKRK